MDDSKIKQLLAKCSRFVAFVDVLGYGSIVTGDLNDESKFKRLHSLFEAFGVAFVTAVGDFNQDLTPADPAYVHAVSFSDSLYLSCKELPSLLLFLEGLFSTTYGFQEHIYRTDPDNWTPFIRAGIVFGWAVNFRDMSMRPLPDRSEFRNPVGPAVADAYRLTEKTGRLRGMRCYLRRSLIETAGAKRISDPAHFELVTPSRTVRLLDVPVGDAACRTLNLVELAWPIHAINGGNASFYKPLLDARSQCTSSEAVKHYNGTVDLFERSIQVVSDEVAKQIWSEKASNARLPLGDRDGRPTTGGCCRRHNYRASIHLPAGGRKRTASLLCMLPMASCASINSASWLTALKGRITIRAKRKGSGVFSWRNRRALGEQGAAAHNIVTKEIRLLTTRCKAPLVGFAPPC